MKLLVNAAPYGSVATNNIKGEMVNGIDLSNFPEGGTLILSADILAAGIYDVERINGVLHVTIGQCGLPYECHYVNGEIEWHGTGEWIDAADYDPSRCYIVATSAPEGAEYVKRENGWTVTLPQVEEEPTP